MPKKGLSQGIQKEENVEDIYKKVEVLEHQIKKINMLEEYIKRFIKVEERIGLVSLKERLNQGEFIKTSQMVDKEEWENQILSKVQEMIKTEMEPFQQMFVNFHNRIFGIENEVTSLKTQLKEQIIAIQSLLEKKIKQEDFVKENLHEGQPIIFQEIHVDKLFMDKYEQTNNLGQVGINQLSGHLTIGATYDKGVIPHELAEEWKAGLDSLQQIKENEIHHKTDHDISVNAEND